ncbi:MAG: hypothetical protein ACEPOV_10890 [Hyphomicrobiales bacterium]
MDRYTLNVINNSTQNGNFCVFQENPDITDPYVMSLAWFNKYAFPKTKLSFNWTIDYGFVWSQTGRLTKGVIFNASQDFPANLKSTNQITISKEQGAYYFHDQRRGPKEGTLYIEEDNTIPSNQVSVGISMSGKGTFAVQGQPNMSALFTPHPKYYVVFGNFIDGEVLDVTKISNKFEIDFPPNVYSVTAVFNPDNTWSMMTTEKYNSQIIAKEEAVH